MFLSLFCGCRERKGLNRQQVLICEEEEEEEEDGSEWLRRGRHGTTMYLL